MADELALTHLFDAVVSRFSAEGTAGTHVFGWREPPQQLDAAPRIVWVPGDPSGALGEITGAHRPGTPSPGRPLRTLEELFQVYLHDRDSTDPENERTQYIATRKLFDAWLRAVYLAVHGAFEIVSAAWLTDARERRSGATIRVVGAIMASIPDIPPTTAPADTDAHITPEISVDGSTTQDPLMVIEPE